MEALVEAGAAAAPGTDGAGRALVLVGFMGAGKSSTARMLAAGRGVQAVGRVRGVERELGEPSADFFDREGGAAFRAREEEIVLRLLSDPRARVVALGGGSLGSERVRDAVARHVVVHLEVDPAEAWRRASNKGRPLARDQARFTQLHRDRATLYDSVAHAILPAGDRHMPRRALAALDALRTAPQGTRLVWASARSGDYPVFLGRGLVGSGFFHPRDERRFAVTDGNVVAAGHVMDADASVAIPAGETEK